MIVLRTIFGMTVGVVALALGTVAHRGHQPWGLVGALALVLASATMIRAWGGWISWWSYLVGAVVVLFLAARSGPGGDVLIPAGDAIGWIWLLGSVAVVVIVAAAPRQLFVERDAHEETEADRMVTVD